MAEPFRGSVRPQTAQWPAAGSPPQPEVSSIRHLPEISSPEISPFPNSSIAFPIAEIGGGKVIDVRRKVAGNQKAVKRARTTGANSAGMRDRAIRETQNGERSTTRNWFPGAWLFQPGIVQLGHVPANPLGGPFEIGPVQGWQLVAIGHSIESHALCGRADRLEIRRSQSVELIG